MTSPRTSLKILVKEASEIYKKMIEGRNFNMIRPNRHYVLTNLESLTEEKIAEEILAEHQTQTNRANFLNFGTNRRLENILEALANISNAIIYKTSLETAEKAIEALKYKGQTIVVTNTPAADSKPQDTQPDINFEACYNSWADKVIKVIKSIPPKPEETPVLTPLQLAEKKILALEAQLTKANSEKSSDQKKMDEKKLEHEAINKTLAEMQKKLTSTECLNASLTNDLQDVQKQLKDAKAANEAKLNGMVFDFESRITKLKDQKDLSFKSLNDQLLQEQTKLKSLEALNSNLKKEIQAINHEKFILERKLSFANQEFSTNQAALVNQTISNKKLEMQITEVQNDKAEKIKALNEALKKYRSENLTRVDLETRLKEYDNKIVDLNKQKVKLQTNCGDLHKKVASLEETLKKAKDEYNHLEEVHTQLVNKQAAASTAKLDTVEEEDNSQNKNYATRARRSKANYGQGMFTKTNKPSTNYSPNYGGPASGPK